MRQAHPLRAMSTEEERALQRAAKATSERVDVVRRAQALLSVRAGASYTHAGFEAGYKGGDSASQVGGRFNPQGPAAVATPAGRGGKGLCTLAHQERGV